MGGERKTVTCAYTECGDIFQGFWNLYHQTDSSLETSDVCKIQISYSNNHKILGKGVPLLYSPSHQSPPLLFPPLISPLWLPGNLKTHEDCEYPASGIRLLTSICRISVV